MSHLRWENAIVRYRQKNGGGSKSENLPPIDPEESQERRLEEERRKRFFEEKVDAAVIDIRMFFERHGAIASELLDVSGRHVYITTMEPFCVAGPVKAAVLNRKGLRFLDVSCSDMSESEDSLAAFQMPNDEMLRHLVKFWIQNRPEPIVGFLSTNLDLIANEAPVL